MGRYVARRLGQMVITLIGATMVLFTCLFVLPGDPVGSIAGSDKARDPAVVAELRQRYGLDKSLPEQYVNYVKKVTTGDLGEDYIQRREVSEILGPKLANTAKLAAFAIVLISVFGMGVGIIAALYRYSALDVTTTFLTTALVGFPTFVIGFLLKKYLALELQWLPIDGDSFDALILPALTLALVDIAFVARLTRGTMLEVLRADYVKTAVAKGLPRRRVLFKHVLRNSVIPVVTYLGIAFGALLGGALITETIFNWDGAGLALVQAVQQQNNPIVIGVVTYSVGIFIVLSLLVDMLYAALDPRIRLS
ncbi:ABC transporter permease [Streptomyces sp. NPDC058646]|uniref:ABC transporter permease n=1 Tax=Streptomyces sp. NPDC058646 TaxID=3346574 RepID=UPI00364DD393